jgi:hypothetical protein
VGAVSAKALGVDEAGLNPEQGFPSNGWMDDSPWMDDSLFVWGCLGFGCFRVGDGGWRLELHRVAMLPVITTIGKFEGYRNIEVS